MVWALPEQRCSWSLISAVQGVCEVDRHPGSPEDALSDVPPLCCPWPPSAELTPPQAALLPSSTHAVQSTSGEPGEEAQAFGL